MEGPNENSERENQSLRERLHQNHTKGMLPQEIVIEDEIGEEAAEYDSFVLTGSGGYTEAIKNFLGFSGGSILYCLSAACIMYGLCQIIGPKLATSVNLLETLPCIMAVNLYELALIGILLLIVLCRNVLDDAIFILVLIAVFLVTSGLTLGTITPGNPKMCIVIGMVCVVLGVGKLYVLRRYIGVPFAFLTFIGMTVFLLWNFLVTPIMALAFDRGVWPDDIRLQWLVGWLVLLVGALMILADAIRSKRDVERQPAVETPFIRKPAMVWVFALVLLGGGCYYQYAIGYMFVVETALGDYLPLAAICALLAVELVGCFGKRYMRIGDVVACVPLALTVLAILGRNVSAGWGLSIELLWYPPVMLAVCCGIILVQAVACRRESFYYVAIAYALGVLLTFGYSPESATELNWTLCGGGVFAIVLTLGIMKRNINLCFGAVVLLAGGLGMSDELGHFARSHGLTIPGAITCVAGLGAAAVCLIFAEKAHKGMILFAGICLMVAIFDYQSRSLGWKDLGILAVIAALSAGLWLRLGMDSVYAIPLCVPLIPRCYMLAVAMSSWGFILLSFVLLIMGGAVSFYYKHDLPDVIHVSDACGKTWVSESNE